MKLGNLTVSSKSFGQHGKIPKQHTVEGEGKSPQIEWKGVPSGTKQLVLICHDPDAPLPNGFTHWVVYGMPPQTTALPEGEGSGFTQGVNDTGRPGYMGPPLRQATGSITTTSGSMLSGTARSWRLT